MVDKSYWAVAGQQVRNYISKVRSCVLVWLKLFSAVGFYECLCSASQIGTLQCGASGFIVPSKLFNEPLCEWACVCVCVRAPYDVPLYCLPVGLRETWILLTMTNICFLFTCTVFIINCGLFDVHIQRQSNALSLLMIHKALKWHTLELFKHDCCFFIDFVLRADSRASTSKCLG